MESGQMNWLERIAPRIVRLCLLLTMMGVVVLLASLQAQDANADLLASDGPNCRYGVSSWDNEDHPFMEQMNIGWTLDFSPNPSRIVPAGIEYTPMIRLDGINEEPPYYMKSPDTVTALTNLIDAYPGKLWIVGNEVDRIYWQDQIYPDKYAEAYYHIYHLIKERDPSAQVSISGLVEVTPGRLQYLDIVWDTYLEKYGTAMPVDVWNMHVYVMPEAKYNSKGELVGSRAGIALGTDSTLSKLESDGTPNQCHLDQVYCMVEHDNIEIFKQQVVAMRQWMKEHGQQNKPLILSEFSLLYAYADDGATCFEMDEYGNCFEPTRVSQFMTKSFDYLETAADSNLGYPKDNNRLVQQWLWFSMNDKNDDSPNRLIDDPEGALAFTQMGNTFRNYTTSKTLYQNLFSDQDIIGIVATGTPTTTLSFDIRNNGNTVTTKPFTVTYYSDEARTQEIGSIIVPAGLGGCARTTVTTATVEWGGLQTGVNWFWAEIDSNNDLGADEPDKSDNVVQGFVLYNPEQVFLPAVLRQ